MRTVKSANEFFDIMSSMGVGKFASIGYVSAANLNIPTEKRKNPKTNRMKGYEDYATFSKEVGYDEEIGGIIKFTRYSGLNWASKDSMDAKYKQNRQDIDDIKAKYGIGPTDRRAGYQGKVEYGDNGIAVYSGNNDALKNHIYTSQNVYSAKKIPYYYVVSKDGNIIEEIPKDKLLSYFKGEAKPSGVSALQKLGADDATIENYIKDLDSLKFSYRTFEGDSILYMVGTINENGKAERIIYINDKLNKVIRKVEDELGNETEIKINPSEFIAIANSLYQKDIEASESVDATPLNEAKSLIERMELICW